MTPVPPAALPDRPARQIPPTRWWHDQVVYQIYPRSFCDSNGDGIGDLAGILGKLDHLQALGVGVVWLSPIYRSPMVDNGYDISDYRDIAPEFGTLADFDALVAALHARGIRLMLDLVVNHCSDQHPWFLQGSRSRDDPHHDYFIWAEPRAALGAWAAEIRAPVGPGLGPRLGAARSPGCSLGQSMQRRMGPKPGPTRRAEAIRDAWRRCTLVAGAGHAPRVRLARHRDSPRRGPGFLPPTLLDPGTAADPHTGSPPNNWEAAFSGPAWTFNAATGEYYLHLFSPQQPDLNWRNPRLRAEVHDILRFWLARGVDGFRMDVINLIAKPWQPDGSLADAPMVQPGPTQPAFAEVVHGPKLLDYLRELRREVLDPHDLITVGEAPLATPAQGIELTDPQTGALDMLFQFEHMDLDCQPGAGKWALKPLHLPDLKHTMQRWQDALHGRGWNSLYLGNHDQPRPVSRWGDDGCWRVQSAKMLGTWLHGQQGTPYVYQGEELGMTNMPFTRIEDCRDIESINHHRAALQRGQSPEDVMTAIRAKGRDNARTPMPWSAGAEAGPHAGFTSGTPWLALNPNFGQINAEQALADADSVFHHYRQLIQLRQQHPVWVHGCTLPLLAEHPQIAAYLRVWQGAQLLVVCNFSGQPQDFEAPVVDAPRHGWQLLLGNWPVDLAVPEAELSAGRPTFELRPYEARVYLGND